MDRDPRIDPRNGDFVQVGDFGREVHVGTRNLVTYRSQPDGVIVTVTLSDWREWARVSKVFHTNGGHG